MGAQGAGVRDGFVEAGEEVTRRDVLKKGIGAGAALALGMGAGLAQSGFTRAGAAPGGTPGPGWSQLRYRGPLYLYGWTAVVDVIQQRVKAFEAATGIPVDYSNTAWAGYHEGVVTKFVGNAPMDVVYCSDHWLSEWVEAGWITPVDEMPGLQGYLDQLMPSAIQAATYKGRFYGLPYYGDYMAFMYHEGYLQRAGVDRPPSTWQEVIDVAKKVKASGILEYPILLPLAQETWLTEYLYSMVYSRGGSFFDADAEPVFDAPDSPALEALQWLIDAIHTHKVLSPAAVETGELAALKAIQAGQVAMTLMPRYRLANINDPKQSQVAGKFKQALIPGSPGSRRETVAWIRPYVIASQAARNRDRMLAAWRLMEWLGGRDDRGEFGTAKAILFAAGVSFVVKPLFRDPEVQKFYTTWGDPAIMEEQYERSRSKDGLTPYFPEWNTFNNTQWGRAILRQIGPRDALRQSAAKWRELKRSWA